MKNHGIKILSAILAMIILSAALVSCMREADPGGAGRTVPSTEAQTAPEPSGTVGT